MKAGKRITKDKRTQINKINLYLKEPEKKKQVKLKVSERKKIIRKYR